MLACLRPGIRTAYSLMAVVSERTTQLREALTETKSRIRASLPADRHTDAVLVAVSKYKPISDILACCEAGQLDFGENFAHELAEKAPALPESIRWHFIGVLQSNKVKILASVPNLYAVQTITSVKVASAMDRALPSSRTAPLNVLVQINTSGEASKSGVAPLSSASARDTNEASTLVQLSKYIITSCPNLRLQGLMTIGSIEQSRHANMNGNEDFETLKETRDVLTDILADGAHDSDRYGRDGMLLLSMGMSGDFEAALRIGSDIVRVGTAIFGERPKPKT